GCSVLPIDLVSFEVEPDGCTNIVTWVTATEENVAYFELSRSEDGIDFTEIERVFPTGGTDEARYELIDEDVSRDYYYQLKSVDLDGTFEIHPVAFAKTLCCYQQNAEDFKVSPNPSSGVSQVQFNWCSIDYNFSIDDDKVVIRVFDQLGRLAYNKEINEVHSGFNQHQLDLSALPSGVYNLTIESPNWQSGSKKFVKL
ncbi:MAG: T9SS type A sorting domain-containing protein, partial [Saprospiraceae bacterium]|nr:T9SS type A sorting domain-containing protein [Saprospiraceae bacterium]